MDRAARDGNKVEEGVDETQWSGHVNDTTTRTTRHHQHTRRHSTHWLVQSHPGDQITLVGPRKDTHGTSVPSTEGGRGRLTMHSPTTHSTSHGSGARVLTPRPTKTRVTGDQPKKWRVTTQEPIWARQRARTATSLTTTSRLLCTSHHKRNVNADWNTSWSYVDKIKIACGRRLFLRLPCASQRVLLNVRTSNCSEGHDT